MGIPIRHSPGIGTCLLLSLLCAMCAQERIIQSPTGPSPSTPPPTASGPVTLTVSPSAVGIVVVTTFRFTASNFVARSGSLRYSWEFGDGSAVDTTAPTVDHVYRDAGTFVVRVFGVDSAAGRLDTAAISGLRVVNLSGSWAIREPGGRFIIERGVALTQDGNTLRGDITAFGSCLVGVTGSIRPDPAVSLSFTMVRDGCSPRLTLPLPSSFSGAGNAALDAFTGNLTGVGPAVISRCANNTTVVNCQ